MHHASCMQRSHFFSQRAVSMSHHVEVARIRCTTQPPDHETSSSVRIKKCVNKNVIPKKKLSSRNIHAYSISTRIQPINELSLLSRFGTRWLLFEKKMELLHHSILPFSKKAKEVTDRIEFRVFLQ
jgi:hypothetical protein